MSWKQTRLSLPYKDWPDIPESPLYPESIWKQYEGMLPKKNWPEFYNVVDIVPQDEYIRVFDMSTKQDQFNRNGERILCPTRCMITEDYNGTWELILEHPVDDDGAWEHIIEQNIIKALGQLFTIITVDSDFSDGIGKITAYAKHITYQIADGMIYDADIDEYGVKKILNRIRDLAMVDTSPTSTVYNFLFDSDVLGHYKRTIKHKNPLAIIMGNDSESVIGRFGGEIYRDNFYFSIMNRMENSLDNAFDIRVGLNLRGINRRVDYSNFATYLKVTGQDGRYWICALPSWEGARFPHQVFRGIELRYSRDVSMDDFADDAMEIFKEMSVPTITYKVTVADLRKNPDYKDFKMFRLKVGDTGRIYDSRLNINIIAKITSTVTDAITGEVVEVTFGNKPDSITRQRRYANSIAGDSPAEKEAERLRQELKETQSKLMRNHTHGDMHIFMHRELHKFRHSELRGGNNG